MPLARCIRSTAALRGSFETRFGHDCHRSADVHLMRIVRASHRDGAIGGSRALSRVAKRDFEQSNNRDDLWIKKPSLSLSLSLSLLETTLLGHVSRLRAHTHSLEHSRARALALQASPIVLYRARAPFNVQR